MLPRLTCVPSFGEIFFTFVPLPLITHFNPSAFRSAVACLVVFAITFGTKTKLLPLLINRVIVEFGLIVFPLAGSVPATNPAVAFSLNTVSVWPIFNLASLNFVVASSTDSPTTDGMIARSEPFERVN